MVTLYTNIVNGACCTRRWILVCIYNSLISSILQGLFDTSGRGKKVIQMKRLTPQQLDRHMIFYSVGNGSSNNNVILLCTAA